MLLWDQKLSEVERTQNRQKLGCVPFLCGKKSLTAGGQVPLTDRMARHGWIPPPLDPPVSAKHIHHSSVQLTEDVAHF